MLAERCVLLRHPSNHLLVADLVAQTPPQRGQRAAWIPYFDDGAPALGTSRVEFI